MKNPGHASSIRSVVIAAAVICALLGWTSSCIADGVQLPVRNGVGISPSQEDHSPGKPDTCCQQISKLSAPACKVILPLTRLSPHADWSIGMTPELMLTRVGNQTFSAVASPGTSPPPYILRAWPNAPPAA